MPPFKYYDFLLEDFSFKHVVAEAILDFKRKKIE